MAIMEKQILKRIPVLAASVGHPPFLDKRGEIRMSGCRPKKTVVRWICGLFHQHMFGVACGNA